jgi:hypothetical protein
MGLSSGDLMISPQLESESEPERFEWRRFLILYRLESLDLRMLLLLKYSSRKLPSCCTSSR